MVPCEGNPPMDPPHKGPAMQKALLYRDVIMS